jgi:hypothetical protein
MSPQWEIPANPEVRNSYLELHETHAMKLTK